MSLNHVKTGYEIPPQNRHDFTTYLQFQIFIKQQSANEGESDRNHYLAIHKVPVQLISQIEENRTNLPRMRLHYDVPLETLTIKLITVCHEIAAAEFREMFLDCCQTAGIAFCRDLVSLRGSSHQSVDGQHLKEPDDAFKPETARPHVRQANHGRRGWDGR